jgi:hypothetical protein
LVRSPAGWWWRLATVAALGAALTAVALTAVALPAVALPAAAVTAKSASRPLVSWPAGVFAGAVNIAVSRTGVWVFDDAAGNAHGSVVKLSRATGRWIKTIRERKPGQGAWVVAAYDNHPWTTLVSPGGVPVLAEVSATGAFTHRVNLSYGLTPDGPIGGSAALAGDHVWAAAAAPDGSPASLAQVSASSGTKTGLLRWPRALAGFSPQGMAASGSQLWMTDGGCQVARVTTSTGRASIFHLPARDCQLGTLPADISAASRYVFVQAYASDVANYESVAELYAADGQLVRLFSYHKYVWDNPAFAAAGPYLWVTSEAGGFRGKGWVIELSARTGRLVHYYSARRYHLDHPHAIAAWGSQVWVLNARSVTRL